MWLPLEATKPDHTGMCRPSVIGGFFVVQAVLPFIHLYLPPSSACHPYFETVARPSADSAFGPNTQEDNQMRKTTFPRIPGFDLNAGSVGLDDPKTVRASRRRGSARWSADEDDLPSYLRTETLDRDFLQTLSRIGGPRARSGEDLPKLLPREVQLVGICASQTVHGECWEIVARPGAQRIRYRFNDEGDPDRVCGGRLVQQSSRRWPSMGDLIWMIDSSEFASGYTGLAFWCLYDQVSEHDANPADLIGSVSVHSQFYPQLSDWYELAFRAWVAEYEQTGEVDSCPDTISLVSDYVREQNGTADER